MFIGTTKLRALFTITMLSAMITYVAVRNTPSGPDLGEYTVTAYCDKACCCGKWADGITASGHVIQPGDKFIAAPPEFAFGMMLSVPGYGVAPVLDRGGAIKGRKLDVFFDDKDGLTGHQRALNWGRQKLMIRRIR